MQDGASYGEDIPRYTWRKTEIARVQDRRHKVPPDLGHLHCQACQAATRTSPGATNKLDRGRSRLTCN